MRNIIRRMSVRILSVMSVRVCLDIRFPVFLFPVWSLQCFLFFINYYMARKFNVHSLWKKIPPIRRAHSRAKHHRAFSATKEFVTFGAHTFEHFSNAHNLVRGLFLRWSTSWKVQVVPCLSSVDIEKLTEY